MFKSLVFGRPIVCEILLERVPLESIPEDPEKAAEWLHKTYVHKVSVSGLIVEDNSRFIFQGQNDRHVHDRRSLPHDVSE